VPILAKTLTPVSVVALSHLFMGTQSNGNPYCGKTITIQYGGKTTTAVVKDKCMGCAYGDIDVSRHCFKEFAAESDGRIPVTWWVN
jgi:expansin (peptidoglycan-binding protein)